VLLHGESRGDPNAFESVLTFAPDGAATRLEMRTVFPSRELMGRQWMELQAWTTLRVTHLTYAVRKR
jgi:hypothetical protein